MHQNESDNYIKDKYYSSEAIKQTQMFDKEPKYHFFYS